jgi:hypothetical protein
MTLPIGLLLAACMAVRAGRGECVREIQQIQLGRLDGRKARKAADFERRGALAKYLIWSLGGYGPLGSHLQRSNEKRQAYKNPRVFLRGHKS